MQGFDSFCVGRFRMHLEILPCLVFLGATLAIEIGIRENQKLDIHLKTCLSTVIEKICPACLTRHLIIPSEPSWEAHAIVSHFSDSSPIYGVTMYTLDRPGYEDPMIDQVGLYLVNTEGVLKTALKHLGEASSRRKYVVCMNFDFGRSLDTYLKNTIPANWNGGSAWDIVFVALIEGSVQVFRTPIHTSGTRSTRSFRKLGICDAKTRIGGFQPLPKLMESQKFILTVTVVPRQIPYIERQTDNPGGYIGKLMNVLKSELDFTLKYEWSVDLEALDDFAKGDDPRIAFNLYAAPKKVSKLASSTLLSVGVWVVATAGQADLRNVFAEPFNTGLLLHVTLLVIYTSAMVYITKDLDKTRIILRLFGMFFGVGVGWWPSKALHRFLVALWCFASYILLQAYLATLTSALSLPTIDEPFRNAKDLDESGIKIFCTNYMKDFYCKFNNDPRLKICEKCRPMSKGTLQLMDHDQLSLNKTWESFAATLDMEVFKSQVTNKFTKMIPERIGAWPAMIYTNMDKEFFQKMKSIARRLDGAGILKYWLAEHYMNNVDRSASEGTVLNMSDLNDTFIVLYVGWSCSIVVLIIEILIKWYRKK